MKTRFRMGIAFAALTVALPSLAAEIEEMIVTATKRETQLQETPIAITAFSEAFIERNQIEDFRDIALQTPGLVFAQTQAMSLITLRGVGLDITNLAGETAIAVYKDGIYQGQTFTLSMPSFDLQRIEVLRGPQGTLYGRNATGGAVNIVTKRPTAEPNLDAALTLGDYEHIKAELGGGGSINSDDSVLVRGSLVYNNRNEGYRDNVTVGGDEDSDETLSARLATIYEPTDSLSLDLEGSFHKQERTGPSSEVLQLAPTALGITPNNLGGFLTFPDPALGGLSLAQVFGLTFAQPNQPVVGDPDDLEYRGNVKSDQKFEIWDVAASLTWNVSDAMTLKSITAYRASEWDRPDSDQDATSVQMLDQFGVQSADQFTQEFNLSGSNDNIDWLIGGFYFYEEADAEFLYDLVELQTTFEAVFGLFSPLQAPLPPGSLAAAGALPTGRRLGDRANLPTPAFPFLDFLMEQESESYALFGETTIHMTDRASVTSGLRWTQDKKDVVRSLTSNLAAPDALCVQREADEDWNEITGQFIVNYAFTDNINGYGKFSRGYKAGGFNPGECNGVFDPETLHAYELGAKTLLLDAQLLINAALFYYDYTDIQINRFVNNASSVQNAAAASITGFEAEFNISPATLDGLTLIGSLTWLDAEYDEGTFSDPIVGGAPIDVGGNRLLRAPEWKFTLGAEYGWPTAVGTFTVAADATYTDEYFFDVFEAQLANQSEMRQESFTVANARFLWESEDQRWQGQLFVENLTDEIYAETRIAVGTTGSIIGEFSAPRTLGLRVSAKLGGS